MLYTYRRESWVRSDQRGEDLPTAAEEAYLHHRRCECASKLFLFLIMLMDLDDLTVGNIYITA